MSSVSGPEPKWAELTSVAIVGSGLIGTSIGLALSRAGIPTFLEDTDPGQRDLAVAMGAGQPWSGERVTHVVVAIPPAMVADELLSLLRRDLAETFSDVSSVKTQSLAEIQTIGRERGLDVSRICLAHPVAGRERGGATSAQTDLFRDRPWVLCPAPDTSDLAVGHAKAVAEAAGAFTVEIEAMAHDALLARISHVPQLVSSATAAALGDLSAEQAGVAGQGARDVIRLAGSDPRLWGEIVAANAPAVAAALGPVVGDLQLILDACRDATQVGSDEVATRVGSLVSRGQRGRANLPAKPGATPTPWTVVDIVVPDRPGELARLLTTVGEADINVEDLEVEHGHSQPAGVLHLSVMPDSVQRLVDIATHNGWRCTPRNIDVAI